MILLVRRQHIEFLDFEAEQISEAVGESSVRRDGAFVHQAGVKRADQRAAVLDVQLEAVSIAAGKEMQRWGEDDLVFGKIFAGARKIHGDIAVMQRVVYQLNMFAQA